MRQERRATDEGRCGFKGRIEIVCCPLSDIERQTIRPGRTDNLVDLNERNILSTTTFAATTTRFTTRSKATAKTTKGRKTTKPKIKTTTTKTTTTTTLKPVSSVLDFLRPADAGDHFYVKLNF